MPEKVTIELGDIQKTLLLPLWIRAVETQKKAPLLVDKSAVEIVEKMANKMVIKNSGMDEKSFFKWGLKSSKLIQQWDSRINILHEDSLFKNAKKGYDLKTKIGLLLSDLLKMQYMVHLKITR